MFITSINTTAENNFAWSGFFFIEWNKNYQTGEDDFLKSAKHSFGAIFVDLDGKSTFLYQF